MMKRKSILYGFIVWAGLLVAVLYSPMGSPDLYNTNMAYKITGNVSFSNVDFSHATSAGRGTVGDVSIGQTDNTVLGTSNPSMGIGQVRTVNGYQNGSISGSSSSAKGNGMAPGAASMSGSGNLAGSSSRSSSNMSVAGPSGSIPMSSDFQGSIVRQGATNDGEGSGLTSPDVEDNNPGQMIPLGDNLAILMMMLGIYAIFRFRRVVNV